VLDSFYHFKHAWTLRWSSFQQISPRLYLTSVIKRYLSWLYYIENTVSFVIMSNLYTVE